MTFANRSAPLVAALVAAACASGHAPPPVPPSHAPQKVDSFPAATAAAAPAAPAAAAAAHPAAVPASGALPAKPAKPMPAAAPALVAAEPFARTERLEWPGPNRYRSASGAPGPDYWQQRADYDIAVTLDTAARTVTGRVTITYTNNSPDTLTFVWLQLDQELYRTGSIGSQVNAEETRWGAGPFRGGYDIRNLAVNGKPAVPLIDDTRMRIKLAQPLAPRGGRLSISMDYAFQVPDHGSDRMGRDGQLYEIAQWYPRMAVYDDVRGWNTDPYLGQGEFYLEYGDIDYAVTVPAGYTVAGSGVLQNPAEVLNAAQRTRLAAAARSERAVAIIAAGEDAPAPRAGMRTWRFRAQNVRDAAWAAAPDFRWDALAWNGVLIQSFYEFAKAGTAWTHGAEYTRWSIRYYSQLVHPYPYPQATSVAGPVGGMEYPMFVMVHFGRTPLDSADVFGTIDHEQGHEWFPMLVGSNERRYAWMDEGINTYLNAFSAAGHHGDTLAWHEDLDDWRHVVADRTQVPLMTPADRIPPGAYGAMAYDKPAVSLLALRDHVVGRETFDEALREYARRWAFKHPTPGDFFRTVENVSGRDLTWFWRGFFYSTDVLDIGVDTARTVATRDGLRALVDLTMRTSIPFPVEMRLKLADGSTVDVSLPVEIWALGDHYQASIPVSSAVKGVRLWPDRSVPDWQPANDTWGDAPPGNARSAVTGGGLASPQGVIP
ncbi:MAG TPA: M1 family metallopeptidase [Gemmatimonadaceae bacterium]|nr:M1 family metallopeptidase [Gemmatimonadaceae bacterium]